MDFEPRTGREQGGRRPALAVSSADFTAITGFAIVCPITSRIRPFPTSVILPTGLPVQGEILVAGVRSIDIVARPVQSAGATVPREVAEEVRAKLSLIITI